MLPLYIATDKYYVGLPAGESRRHLCTSLIRVGSLFGCAWPLLGNRAPRRGLSKFVSAEPWGHELVHLADAFFPLSNGGVEGVYGCVSLDVRVLFDAGACTEFDLHLKSCAGPGVMPLRPCLLFVRC